MGQNCGLNGCGGTQCRSGNLWQSYKLLLSLQIFTKFVPQHYMLRLRIQDQTYAAHHSEDAHVVLHFFRVCSNPVDKMTSNCLYDACLRGLLQQNCLSDTCGCTVHMNARAAMNEFEHT